ncbi:MAG: DEAD/DEAH box helicase family protein [Okeania sp. SIO3I5]|uniref:SNF2-related protein n=1 Tax=Okeania sp. SIO3I5 TaxID=2607805 RepID=UPI0013B67A40|nr:SNF2-related protein [Okeania sp. SIO3I5]NEQ40013.1 DEAD/DEAH box helicase family protein [Okeania sp. SIO3I5]
MSIDNNAEETQWPEHNKFPYNSDKNFVETVIRKDLEAAKNPLIITGYASLDKIIDFLADNYHKFNKNSDAFAEIRLLLGHEPYPTKTQEFPYSHKFDREIEEYWLKQRISILKCGAVIAAIELLKTEKIEVKISDKKPIHAKIYRSDNAITIGSSNFSSSGFVSQIEANVRFENIKKESQRFQGAEVLSEKIWELGKDYKDELIKLLKQLLNKVSWQEALARACVELLEGEWAKQYQITSYFGDENPLWPSQIQGIAQAIWVIENVGSVLIADATGSGKTRMGAHLIKSVINQIWATGRKRKGSPVLICPPDAVQQNWDREFNNCDLNLKTYSYGILQTKRSNKYEQLKEAICRSQVLAVDEAHKFLNRRSQQTQGLFNNMADYVILFTATPINRGSQDLLAIIELLGADNFDDELLEILQPLWKQGKLEEKMLPGMRKKLRMAIQHFTVRRTKNMLNQMIDENPELYQDRFGKQCRYPQHESKTYTCGENQSDRSLAQQIRELTQEMRGLVMLHKAFEVSEYLRKLGISDEDYLNMRLESASRLSNYNVMSCLRSSKVALLEHIYGTEYAQKYLGLVEKIKGKETGNMIQKLDSMADKPPQNQLKIELPDWLSDRDTYKYKQECEREIEIYEKIADLTQQISDFRESKKAQHLQNLLQRHQLLIAFDSKIITLSDIKQRIDKLKTDCQKVIIATGVKKTERQDINESFQLGSTASGVIALCSDAMSEGVNLQQASAVVLLDMPSVIRLVEQRIGRIDRLDSPHHIIEVWWPKDTDEFALRSSEQKLGKRHRLVSNLLGSNFPLPEDLAAEIDDDFPLPEDLSEDDEVVISCPVEYL